MIRNQNNYKIKHRSLIGNLFIIKTQIKRITILAILFFIKSVFAFSYTLDDYAKNPFGNVLFIRHALAPGFGDPKNFVGPHSLEQVHV